MRTKAAISLTIATLAAAGIPAALADAPPPDPGFTGMPHCRIPRVHGLRLKKAKRKLRAALCDVGFVTRERSRVKKGRVLLSVPGAGVQLAARTPVDLVVSRGRR